MSALRPAPGVHMATDGQSAALLAVARRGRPWFASGSAPAILAALDDSNGDVEAAVQRLLDRWPAADRDVVRADFQAFTEGLVRNGLLSRCPTPAPWPRRPAQRPPIPDDAAKPGPALRVAAFPALLAAVVVLRTGALAAGIRLAEAVHRLIRTQADPAAAGRAIAAVRTAARWWPGRAACVETSLAATLLLAACGRRADWTIGARFAPHTAHAWIALDGAPVAENDPDGWDYHPAISI